MAFLKGHTSQGLAEATGERGRAARFSLQPGSAPVLGSAPGFARCDVSRHSSQRLKPGTGARDAPQAVSLKLRGTTGGFGIKPASCDEEFEASSNLLPAKQVDNVDMPGTEGAVDKCANQVR
eukprot:3289205-Pyramimonas_sp.AAC.1